MALAYTKMPENAFEQLQINAGILVDSFSPATGEYGNILGATSGGINFATNPTYSDFGEDVDNCPANTKQLKRIVSYDPTISGTFLTCTPETIAALIGAADVSDQDSIRVIPREQLVDSDFTDIWFVGDYSDKNTGAAAGFLAVHVSNALNATGFQIQSTKDAKGTMSFEYHGHYDMENMSAAPFEIYCKAGSDGTVIPEVKLNTHVLTVADEATATLTASVKPYGSVVTWGSANTSVASVAAGVVTGEGSGNTIITASITVDGVTYNDTCTVIVPA